jgi:hypothetical protein
MQSPSLAGFAIAALLLAVAIGAIVGNKAHGVRSEHQQLPPLLWRLR